MSELRRMLTVKEVAAHFGVRRETLWRWRKRGLLIPRRFGERGELRYRAADVEAFERKMPAAH